MTSRERLLIAISGGIADRVPVSTYELCGYNSKSFENLEPTYRALMEYIRAHTDCINMWNPQRNDRFFSTAYPAECHSTEHREENMLIINKTLHTPKGILTQEQRKIDNVYTVWQTEHWCKNPEDVDRAMSIPFLPATYDWSDYSRIRAELGENGIVMATVDDAFCGAMQLMEFGDATVWAFSETEHFENVVKILHERVMENLKRMLEGNVVELYRLVGAEYATAPYMPPSFFQRYVKPCVTEMTELIHQYGGKVRLHSHGKIRDNVSMILETGVDAIDPCEAPPDGDITLGELKELTKNKLCLFGNLQLKLLENADTKEVVSAVKTCIKETKDGGGFVIMPTASPINVPLSVKTMDNYKVFIETALEYGCYE